MRTTLEPEDIQAITEAVIDKLRPMLSDNNGKSETDIILTLDEAAKFLKTSKGQIYQWVNNAQHGLRAFPYMKAGRLLRFSQRDLLKWMQP